MSVDYIVRSNVKTEIEQITIAILKDGARPHPETDPHYRFTRSRTKPIGDRFERWSDWKIEYRGPKGKRWVPVNASFQHLPQAQVFAISREARR